MIIADIHKNASGEITSLTVADHAGYAEEGKDIICAAASTLVYTAIGSLQRLCGLKDFYRIVEASDEDSIPFSEIVLTGAALSDEQRRISQVILQTVETGFLQLEESVGEDSGNQFIRVTETTDDK